MVSIRGLVLVVAIAVMGVVAIATAGCARGGSDLQWLGNPAAAGLTVPNGSVLSYKFPPVCTTGDPVRILDIQPSEPNAGVKVVYWAIQPNEFQMPQPNSDGIIGDLVGERFPVVPGQVTAPNAEVSGHCPTEPTAAPKDILSQVLITMDRTANKSVATNGFIIRYSTGSETKELFMPYGMTLCLPNDDALTCGGA